MAAQSSTSTTSNTTMGDAQSLLLDATEESEWHIPWSRITLGKELGEGAYGVVYRAEYTGLPIAAKKLKGEIAPEAVKEEFEQEVATLKKLRHPNIILFMGITQDPQGNMFILSEFGANGSLDRFLSKEHRTWTEKAGYVMEICLALAYLHDNACLHRDLKAENVLVSHARVCKVADFGLARTFLFRSSDNLRSAMQATSGIGSLWWRAPEVDDPTGEYSEKIDVFSLGITIAEIITNGQPGDDLRLAGTTQDPHNKLKWIYNSEMLRPTLNELFPPAALVDMVVRCGRMDPALRPSVAEVLGVAKKLYAVVQQIEQSLKASASQFCEFGFRLINPRLTWEAINGDLSQIVIEKTQVFQALSDRLKEKTKLPLDDIAFSFLETDGGARSPTFTVEGLIKFLSWYQNLELLILNPLILPLFSTRMIIGFISKNLAESLVHAAPLRSIVVRFSSRPGNLAITYRKSQEEISHALVKVTESGLVSGPVVWRNFGEMIKEKQYLYACPDRPLSDWDEVHKKIEEECGGDTGEYGASISAGAGQLLAQAISGALPSSSTTQNSTPTSTPTQQSLYADI